MVERVYGRGIIAIKKRVESLKKSQVSGLSSRCAFLHLRRSRRSIEGGRERFALSALKGAVLRLFRLFVFLGLSCDDLGGFKNSPLIVRFLDPSLKQLAHAPQGGLRFRLVGPGQVAGFVRVILKIVQFFLRHHGLAEEVLCWREFSFSMKFLEQVPDGIRAFLVGVRLQERAVRREVADVAVAGVAHGPEPEHRLVASVARSEDTGSFSLCIVAQKIAALHLLGFRRAVGQTPLIRLRALSELTGCTILGKAEFMNPGGSVKDRAALGILLEAEQDGRLAPGGLVVEGTAGNTGIGLAHLCNARGYRCQIVIPDTQSAEKIGLLRSLGAEVLTVPAVPYKDPANYVRRSGTIAAETPGALWANQFDNLANRRAHYGTTGPEIWEQTEGRVDAWVAATGTGGTYAGVALFLKERNPAIRCVLADPHGSALYDWATNGTFSSSGSSITEGIGNSRLTANMEGAPVDDAVRVDDQSALDTIYSLLWDEGLFLGGSVGINVAAAVETARRLGPGHTIVTVLCDSGDRYRSRLYDADWLQSRGLRQPRRPQESGPR